MAGSGPTSTPLSGRSASGVNTVSIRYGRYHASCRCVVPERQNRRIQYQKRQGCCLQDRQRYHEPVAIPDRGDIPQKFPVIHWVDNQAENRYQFHRLPGTRMRRHGSAFREWGLATHSQPTSWTARRGRERPGWTYRKATSARDSGSAARSQAIPVPEAPFLWWGLMTGKGSAPARPVSRCRSRFHTTEKDA